MQSHTNEQLKNKQPRIWNMFRSICIGAGITFAILLMFKIVQDY